MDNILQVSRPRIAPSSFSQPFWEATRDRKLLLQYCRDSGRFQFYPRPLSIFTARRNLEWRESSGCGLLYSFTVARVGSAAFSIAVPYAIGLVELGEGPRVVAGIVNCAAEALRIGMAVEPYWHPLEDGFHLLLFQPAHAVGKT